MSHSRERAEKICLNCNTPLVGRFCQTCGQENLEPRPSFWGLVSHFFQDITHFDGKFFRTVGFLVTRPGFLPAEYIRGKRASYLEPIRMYVFTSAVFFLVFYSFVPKLNEKTFSEVKSQIPGSDSIAAKVPEISRIPQTSAAYDSVQRTLSPAQRDSWFPRLLNRSLLRAKSRYNGSGPEMANEAVLRFVHSLPYLLFLSLPLYALYLLVLYVNKKFIYTDHAIFLIYLYIFTFLVLLSFFGLKAIENVPYIGWLHFLSYPIMIGGVIHTIVSMKRFYRDSMLAVIIRFIILNILAFFTLLALFILFLFLTIIRI